MVVAGGSGVYGDRGEFGLQALSRAGVARGPILGLPGLDLVLGVWAPAEEMLEGSVLLAVFVGALGDVARMDGWWLVSSVVVAECCPPVLAVGARGVGYSMIRSKKRTAAAAVAAPAVTATGLGLVARRVRQPVPMPARAPSRKIIAARWLSNGLFPSLCWGLSSAVAGYNQLFTRPGDPRRSWKKSFAWSWNRPHLSV
ncbi:hypothetical protein ACFRR7_17530 [Streptomyces sp. NPDC056909]|uniref:hypothetical protein n=1 Tax=Streptomyces sp. NPDC056909 TaxID=3345963 RepID=UPI00368B4FB0